MRFDLMPNFEFMNYIILDSEVSPAVGQRYQRTVIINRKSASASKLSEELRVAINHINLLQSVQIWNTRLGGILHANSPLYSRGAGIGRDYG